VSYHGETDPSDPAATPDAKATANLDLIDAHNFVRQNVLGGVTPPAKLEELRAVAFGPDGLLWVVSGAAKTSQILRFSAEGDVHRYVDTIESGDRLASISHPFDIAFHPTEPQWFVSNQDTNIVVGPLAVAKPPLPTPSAAKYLRETYPKAHLCPGTFVASAVKAPTRCDEHRVPAPVPHPQGLEGVFTSKTRHSVRGLAHDDNWLYVADEAADKVKAYDADGLLVWEFDGKQGNSPIKRPVHLLLGRKGLFVGSSGTGAIVYARTPDRAESHVVVADVDELSGMALDSAGETLFYASRSAKQVYCVRLGPGGPIMGDGLSGKPYGPQLTQAPEFITCAPAASQPANEAA
jgi:hypothetical protein